MPFALDDDDVFATSRSPVTAAASRPSRDRGGEDAAGPMEPSPPVAGDASKSMDGSATRISGIGVLV